MISVQFKYCRFDYYPDARYGETIFWDGLQVGACPHDTDSYRAAAKEHGYGDDTLAFCLDHEIAHTWMAEQVGLPYSPVLRAVALDNAKAEDHWQEEEWTMAFQKYLTRIERSVAQGA